MSFARWQPYYTDRELELDRRIHAFGLLLALIATPLLLGLAAESRRPGLVLPCAIYLLSLLGMLGSSTLFRHTPLRWSNYRWFLRRLDHAAIFLSSPVLTHRSRQGRWAASGSDRRWRFGRAR